MKIHRLGIILLLMAYPYLSYTQSILLLSPNEYKDFRKNKFLPARFFSKTEKDELGLPSYLDEVIKNPDNILRDIVQYGQEKIAIENSPLLYFNEIADSLILPNESKYRTIGGINVTLQELGPTCMREYLATWTIKNNKIYLSNIKQYANYRNSNKKVSTKELKKRIENYTKRKFENGLLFADWINGTIIGGVNGSYNNQFFYVYTKEYHIQIENGKVINIQTQTRKDTK